MKVSHQTGGQHHYGKGKKQSTGGGGGAWVRPWTASCILPTGAAGPRATGQRVMSGGPSGGASGGAGVGVGGGPGSRGSLDPKAAGISLLEVGKDAGSQAAAVSEHVPLEGVLDTGKGASLVPGQKDTSLWVAAASPSGGVSLFQISPGTLQYRICQGMIFLFNILGISIHLIK